jgi:hypothetical protein
MYLDYETWKPVGVYSPFAEFLGSGRFGIGRGSK